MIRRAKLFKLQKALEYLRYGFEHIVQLLRGCRTADHHARAMIGRAMRGLISLVRRTVRNVNLLTSGMRSSAE